MPVGEREMRTERQNLNIHAANPLNQAMGPRTIDWRAFVAAASLTLAAVSEPTTCSEDHPRTSMD